MSPEAPGHRPWFHSGLFGLVAPAVGWAPPLRYLLRRSRILKLLRPLPPGPLLEVGCGSGALLDDLARMGHDALGLETSAAALAMARDIAASTGGRQRLVAEPGNDWSGRFDLVCAFEVLEHIADDQAALAQWCGWLRPGGRLCLSVPAHRRRWGAGDEWAGHFRRYDRADFERLLSVQGLQVDHLECYGFPLANLTEWLGNRTYRRLIRERSDGMSIAEASARSGVERGHYLKLFQRVDTLLGRFALRACLGLQAVTAGTNLGSGYLVLARLPEQGAPAPGAGAAPPPSGSDDAG